MTNQKNDVCGGGYPTGRNICVMRLRAKTELPSRVTTRINQTAVAKNHSNFKVLNTVLAVSEYMSSAKSWQEKGCS